MEGNEFQERANQEQRQAQVIQINTILKNTEKTVDALSKLTILVKTQAEQIKGLKDEVKALKKSK